MQRLTWSGVAMHAGHLPGYPASAGCVRTPIEFDADMREVIAPGTTLVLTNLAVNAGTRSAPGFDILTD